MRRFVVATSFLSIVLGAALTQAKDSYVYDWEQSRCARNIKSFVKKAKVHDIYRMRPRDRTGPNAVVIEEGDPNRPTDATKFPDWEINVTDVSAGRRGGYLSTIRKGAWVAFKADGTATNPGYDQRMFFAKEGRCEESGPTTEAGKDDIPADVDLFVRSVLDVDPSQRKGFFARLFGAQSEDIQSQNRTEPATPQAIDPITGNADEEADVLSKLMSDYPTVFAPKLAALQQLCAEKGAESAEMEDGFIHRIDINGDGRDDWIYDGRQVDCIAKDGSRAPVMNLSDARLWIVLDAPDGPRLLSELKQDAGEIRRYADFATISYDNGQKLQISGTTISLIDQIPPGGQVVFMLGR